MMPCPVIVPIVCSAIAEEPLPTIEEIAYLVRSSLDRRTTLKLTAHVQRAWRTRDGRSSLKRYRVETQMEGDVVRTQVFNAETGVEAARAARKGYADEEITALGEKEPDGCLFGTLTVSWIGSMAADSTFVRRLYTPECRLVGVEAFGARPCYKVVHRYKVFEDGDKSEWVEQTLCFDKESFLPLRWTSQSREGRTWRGGIRFMDVERSYQYGPSAINGLTPGKHDMATVDDGGAHHRR